MAGAFSRLRTPHHSGCRRITRSIDITGRVTRLQGFRTAQSAQYAYGGTNRSSGAETQPSVDIKFSMPTGPCIQYDKTVYIGCHCIELGSLLLNCKKGESTDIATHSLARSPLTHQKLLNQILSRPRTASLQ